MNARFFALGSLVLVAASCSSTVVYVPRTSPAEINLASYKRLAVGGIAGPGADKLVDDVTQALVQTQAFDVLDRKHLSEIVKEQDFAVSGRVSDETAVSIGQMIGSAALLVGDVSAYDYKEGVTSKRSECTKDGKKRPCTQYTRTGSARVAVAFKVLDTETGKVLAAKTLEGRIQRSADLTDQQPPAFDKRDEWLAGCRRQVVTDFMKVIAPYQVSVGVELLDDGDLPELEVGNNYAKLGKWQDAIAQYRAAIARADKSPDTKPKIRAKALYDLGVGLAYSGKYDDGVTELERAYSLEPSDAFIGQINRVKQFKADDQKLADQRAAAGQ